MGLHEKLERRRPESVVRRTRKQAWKILVADADELIHQKVSTALDDLSVLGRPIEILHAYSSEEAVGLMVEHPDTAMAILDMDLRSEGGGLHVAETIRLKLNNQRVRLIMVNCEERDVPANDLVTRYDINDIRNKSDLSQSRLFTLTYSNLHHYHELTISEENREGLERIADASSTILRRKLPERLARGALELLCSILGVDQYAERPAFEAVLLCNPEDEVPRLLAVHGRYDSNLGPLVPPETIARISAIKLGSDLAAFERDEQCLVARIPGDDELDMGLYLRADREFKPIESHVINLFCRNVANSLHAADAHQAQSRTQNNLILMLSEAIERRSQETGNHVRRVGEYSRLLGSLYGLDEEQADILLIGAALHDAGKVAIPDAILNKPGRLTDEERSIMETHAEIGGELFANQDLPVLRAAMVIAIQHHERWDGSGYPKQLSGENIHIFGRIAGLADVFDALGSHRCYKRAWPLEKVLDVLREERGKHFDPDLVDLFLNNLDKFLEIRDRFVDPPPPDSE